MEKNLNYDQLRKLYYSNESSSPSHTKVPNLRSIANTAKLNVEPEKQVITDQMIQSEHNDEIINEKMNEDIQNVELNEFKKELNKRSSDIINALYDKYGSKTYSKITQMINNEDFSEWNELENSLKEQTIAFNIVKYQEANHDFLELLNDSELFNDVVEVSNMQPEVDEDYAYLDALVSQDYKKLRTYQAEESNISSIFNEILQNEERSNQNYQDDVFTKNIELIYNQAVDLDNDDWTSVSELNSLETVKLNLNDAVDFIKENVESMSSFEINESSKEIQQAELKAFYSDTKLEIIEKEEAEKKLAEVNGNEKTTFFKTMINKLKKKNK